MVLYFLQVCGLFVFVIQGDERQPVQLGPIVERENDELSRRDELIVTSCVLFAIYCLFIPASICKTRELSDAAMIS